jgi:hypothetical protein
MSFTPDEERRDLPIAEAMPLPAKRIKGLRISLHCNDLCGVFAHVPGWERYRGAFGRRGPPGSGSRFDSDDSARQPVCHFYLLSTRNQKMAKLALIYGMRLLPEEDLGEVRDATVVLKNGKTARIAMHLIEGSKEEIEATFHQSVQAFFEMYPEI